MPKKNQLWLSFGSSIIVIRNLHFEKSKQSTEQFGHTGSWAAAYPDIVTCANMFWLPAGTTWADRLASEPGTGHLNPLNPKTYQVVKNVIADIVNLFPEPFYHAGADEIIPGCWKADPDIQSFLSNNGTLSDLLETFIKSTLPYILSLNRTVVYWEDILLDENVKVDASILPREHTILQTWNNGPNNTKLIVSAGYRTIVSSSEFYYLDCGHGDFLGNDSQYNQPPTSGTDGDGGSWCNPFKTWQTIYNYDITYGLSEDEAKLVLGGEVALWSEQADSVVLDARIWPRSSTMAETLWSGNKDETVSAGYDQSLRTRDCRSHSTEPIQVIDAFQESVMSVCVTKTKIIGGSVDGTIRTFDIRIGREVVDNLLQPVNCISMSINR